MANRNFEPRLAKLEKIYPARERVEVFITPAEDTLDGRRAAVQRELAQRELGIDRAAVYLVRCLPRRGNELFEWGLTDLVAPYSVSEFIGAVPEAAPLPVLVPSNLIHSFNYNAAPEEN